LAALVVLVGAVVISKRQSSGFGEDSDFGAAAANVDHEVGDAVEKELVSVATPAASTTPATKAPATRKAAAKKAPAKKAPAKKAAPRKRA
ncbi:MAG: hypothetical protein Q8K72_11250, partial [Acidimicrobiales bacterium]|nr:hypothetical protein [Acidimicrobiales bacterium]